MIRTSMLGAAPRCPSSRSPGSCASRPRQQPRAVEARCRPHRPHRPPPRRCLSRPPSPQAAPRPPPPTRAPRRSRAPVHSGRASPSGDATPQQRPPPSLPPPPLSLSAPPPTPAPPRVRAARRAACVRCRLPRATPLTRGAGAPPEDESGGLQGGLRGCRVCARHALSAICGSPPTVRCTSCGALPARRSCTSAWCRRGGGGGRREGVERAGKERVWCEGVQRGSAARECAPRLEPEGGGGGRAPPLDARAEERGRDAGSAEGGGGAERRVPRPEEQLVGRRELQPRRVPAEAGGRRVLVDV